MRKHRWYLPDPHCAGFLVIVGYATLLCKVVDYFQSIWALLLAMAVTFWPLRWLFRRSVYGRESPDDGMEIDAWKMFDKKGRRVGTYDGNMNRIGK